MCWLRRPIFSIESTISSATKCSRMFGSEALGEEKQFLQGLIHIAVGLYHAAAENYKGASKQLEKGIRRLTPSLPERDGLDVAGLVEPSRKALEKVERGLRGEQIHWNENDVPAMRFRD